MRSRFATTAPRRVTIRRSKAGYPKTPIFDGGEPPRGSLRTCGRASTIPPRTNSVCSCSYCSYRSRLLPRRAEPGLPAGRVGAVGLLGDARRLVSGGAAYAGSRAARLPDGRAVGGSVRAVVGALREAPRRGIVAGALATLAVSAAGTLHPLIWLCLGPVLFVFYLVFAPRHGPGWHLGLAGISSFGIVPNAWWLIDWARYWWLRQPSSQDHIPLPQWETVIGLPHDYANLCVGLPGGPIIPLIAVAGIGDVMAHAPPGGGGVVAGRGVDRQSRQPRLASVCRAYRHERPARVAPMAVALLVPAAAFGILGKPLEAGSSRGLWDRRRDVGAGTRWLGDSPQCPTAAGSASTRSRWRLASADEQEQLLAAIGQHTLPTRESCGTMRNRARTGTGRRFCRFTRTARTLAAWTWTRKSTTATARCVIGL